MTSMSYCRFENTYLELGACLEHINDKNLSTGEERYRERLVELCQVIIDEQIEGQQND